MALVAAVLPEAVLGALLLGHKQRLAEASVQLAFKAAQQALLVQILVKGLVVPEALQLVAPLPPEVQGPDRDLLIPGLVDGLAQHQAGQAGEGRGQILGQAAHTSPPKSFLSRREAAFSSFLL